MSANIYWRTPKRGTILDVGAPSRFISSMRKAFGGESFWTLTPDSTATLRGMGAVDKHGPYSELADLVETKGTIEVWAEY